MALEQAIPPAYADGAMTGVGRRSTAAPGRSDADEQGLDAAFAVVWDHLVDGGSTRRGPLGRADALFCFGSRDRTVPAQAASLWARGLAPLVVVAGGGPAGDGRDRDRREADAFAADLVARGVPRSAVVVERASRHTGENVVAGMASLARVAEVTSLLSVSWPLAARRCRATFARHHPEVAVRSAPAIDGDRRWPRTDRTVRAALGELDRLRDYVALGYLVAEPLPAGVVAAADRLRATVVATGRAARVA